MVPRLVVVVKKNHLSGPAAPHPVPSGGAAKTSNPLEHPPSGGFAMCSKLVQTLSGKNIPDKFCANPAGLKAHSILRRLSAGVSRGKIRMSSYGLGKLKKSSKKGSKSGSKMEVRGKVGGGRWWWELEKVEFF